MIHKSRKRGSIEIIFDILRHAKTPIKKIQLFAKANLGWGTYSKYFDGLIEGGFIEKIPYKRVVGFGRKRFKTQQTTHLYVITSEGKALCDLFERIYDILGWSELLK